MKPFYPSTGTVEEWNTAYYRLEDYLRAHQVTNKLHQSRIILGLLQRAAAEHARNPSQSPTKLALEEAFAEINHWFQRLLPEEPGQRSPIVGRVSMYIIDATSRWPNVFLAEDHEIPAEFHRALEETLVQSGPDLRVSRMVPRPLDTPLEEDPREETWERLSRLSVLLLTGLGLFIGLAVFYYVR